MKFFKIDSVIKRGIEIETKKKEKEKRIYP